MYLKMFLENKEQSCLKKQKKQKQTTYCYIYHYFFVLRLKQTILTVFLTGDFRWKKKQSCNREFQNSQKACKYVWMDGKYIT